MKSIKMISRKGFTLIELMIVVAIIGILAAVAIPKFADLVTKSKEAAVKGNLGAVRSAVSIYYGDSEGVHPANLFTGLTAANRYMPSVAGISSLGKFEIPSHSGNIGHSGGVYSNASAANAVVVGATPAAATDATGPLLYLNVNTNNLIGEVYINCTHTDTKTQIWTGY